MVLSSVMINKLKRLSEIGLSLMVVFLILNIIHLTWYTVQVEGFWSFFYFVKLTFFVFFIGGISLAYAGTLLMYTFALFENFPKSFTRKNIFSLIGVAAILPLTFGFDIITKDLPNLIFYRKMADRYKYLRESERYLKDKDVKNALDKAISANKQAKNKSTPWPIFVFSYWYAQSPQAKAEEANQRYAAAINYAYCLSHVDTLQRNAVREYLNVLKFCQQPLLKSQPGYKVFPLTELVRLYMSANKPDIADQYNIQLLRLSNEINAEDLSYFVTSQYGVASYALQSGDVQTAASIFINIYQVYHKNTDDRETKEYLSMCLQGLMGYLLSNRHSEAGTLLEEISELAEERKKSINYLIYLFLKARYLEAAALENRVNEKLIQPGILGRFTSLLSGSKSISERCIAAACEAYEEYSERAEDKFGEESDEYITGRVQYAALLLQTTQYQRALEILIPLLENKVLQDSSNQQQRNFISLQVARCNLLVNKTIPDPAAIDNYSKEIYQNAVDNLPFLTENEREHFANKVHQKIQLVNAFLLSSGSSNQNAGHVYNNILATRNLALSANLHIRSLLQDSSHRAFKQAYSTLLAQRSTQSVYGGLQLLIKEKQLIHQIRKLPSYQPYNPQTVTWETVREHLPAEASAVEFITVPDLTTSKGTIWYYALLVNQSFSSPKLVRLCNEQQLAALLNRAGRLQQSTNSIYTASLPRLKELLIHPVLKAAGSSKYFYFSLTGLLHQLSFSALMDGTGHEYEIVSSTRLLAATDHRLSPGGRAVVFGGIDFAEPKSQNSARSASNNFFQPLPYTYKEAVDIKRVLESYQYQTSLASGTAATEAYFRQLSGQPVRIVHLATHGVFEKNKQPERPAFGENFPLFPEDASMSRCKLVFAGANRSQRAPIKSSDDGYISAREISQMNFQHTDLVVLSACESGIGTVSGLEGVQGFQRAFSLAGARHTLVSLWPISDKHTAEIMRTFYSYLLTGKSKAQALRLAQQEMKAKYKVPYYWAGFMLIRGV